MAVANPQFIRIDPAGRLLYATDSTSDLVSFFSIDPVTGQLVSTGTRDMRARPRCRGIRQRNVRCLAHAHFRLCRECQR